MSENVTVGKLRKLIEGLPDETPVILYGNSGERYILPDYALQRVEEKDIESAYVENHGELDFYNPEYNKPEDAILTYLEIESEA